MLELKRSFLKRRSQKNLGYAGQVEFEYNDKLWKAVGHKAQIKDGSFWGKSFIEFFQLTGCKRPALREAVG